MVEMLMRAEQGTLWVYLFWLGIIVFSDLPGDTWKGLLRR